jgi:MerR family transcriptional regulator, copper efflux regulator
MRITEAAQRLGTSPRMLRYRESLGLLPAIRDRPAGRPMARRAASPAAVTARHRRFGDAELGAVSLGLAIERRYDISPAALAFGLRVLTDRAVRAEVAELGRQIGRIQPPPARAIDFEKERALRLLSIADGQRGPELRRPARHPQEHGH